MYPRKFRALNWCIIWYNIYILTDPRLLNKDWRLNHLYKIVDKSGKTVNFQMNNVQAELHKNAHTRNIILKARQQGLTTYECIDGLDDALFHRNFTMVIIAHEKEAVKKIFKKIKFAWDEFPKELKTYMGYSESTDSINELAFNNGSSIRVALSSRADTVTRLHISEFGKICAKYPQKAQEIITGAIPSVPENGRIDIESTAEGEFGEFHDMFWQAWNNPPITHKQFKAFFFPWTCNPEYQLDHAGEIPQFLREYQAKYNLSDKQINWYFIELGLLKEKIKQEYPTCVRFDTLVASPKGLVQIQDLEVDGIQVLAKFNKGVQKNFRLVTEKGYSLDCTNDHPILSQDGFKPLQDLAVGDLIKLSPFRFADQYYVFSYKSGFVDCSIKISEDFARFLGYFMGDGCYIGSSDTISIACDGGEELVIADVKRLFDKFLGGSSGRVVGSKKGGIEIRKSSKAFREPMEAMGLLRQNSNYQFKRKVHVPAFIKCSPKSVIKEFLIGLFESDGFISRCGNRSILFSKYGEFLRDVQLLLLGFGITSRLKKVVKISNKQYQYIGYELVLTKGEVKEFVSQIGFVSGKKLQRAEISLCKKTSKIDLPIKFEDRIASIEQIEDALVYDITTVTQDFIANGIVVHNCPEEAFAVSGFKLFSAEALNSQTPLDGTKIGDWIIFKDYIPSHRYAVGADVAEGVGQDSSTGQVIDLTTNEQVACYKSNSIAPDMFAHELRWAANRYGGALIAPERNNHGHTTIATLKTFPEVTIYQEEILDQAINRKTVKLGWLTTGASKPLMLYELHEAINSNAIKVYDKTTLSELRTYDKQDLSVTRFDPDQTKHWDMVIALAIAYAMRKVFIPVPDTTEEEAISRLLDSVGGKDPYHREIGIPKHEYEEKRAVHELLADFQDKE